MSGCAWHASCNANDLRNRAGVVLDQLSNLRMGNILSFTMGEPLMNVRTLFLRFLFQSLSLSLLYFPLHFSHSSSFLFHLVFSSLSLLLCGMFCVVLCGLVLYVVWCCGVCVWLCVWLCVLGGRRRGVCIEYVSVCIFKTPSVCTFKTSSRVALKTKI